MLKIIQNDSCVNYDIEDSSMIFTSSKNILKLKKKYIDKDILITSIKNYAIKLLDKYSDKHLVSDEESFILMLNSFLHVKNDLKKYNNIDNIEFIKSLIKTYDFYLNNKLNNNEKIDDLKVIYEEYLNELNKHNLIDEHNVYLFLINNIDKIEESNLYFEDMSSLSNDEINFINHIKDNKNVIMYANTINNTSLVSDLNKIDNTLYNETNNEDVNKLFKLGSNNLFKDTNIISTNDLYEEVRFIKNDIIKNINSGLNYKDILIVSNDINRYDMYFKLLFNFPYNKEEETGSLTKNFVELFSNILNGDFTCKAFINILKLNIFNISENKVNELDNYVYIWDLEDIPFYDEFIYNPSGKKDFSEYDNKKLEELNDARISILNPIRYLLENIVKEKETKEILKYIFTYLDEEGIASNLSIKDKEGYNKLVSNFELINDLFNTNSIGLVLDALNMIQSTSVTKNRMLDEVNICDFDNYVNNNYKKVYFIGVTEKDIPSKFSYNTLINNNDLNDDIIFDLINRHNDKENNAISNILLNNNITITYHKLTDENSKVSMSSLLSKLYQKQTNYKYEINNNIKNNLNLKLDSNVSDKLYGDSLVLSPSSLEMFAKCNYSYFLNYGLRLNIKEKMLFDNREVGTFVHYILEKCINNNVTKESISEMVSLYTDLYFKENIRLVNNTIKYVVNELKKSTSILLGILLDELNDTKLKPKYTELKIKDMPLSIKLDKGNLTISGIVDRVDTYEDDNNYYYRIIDYKTGAKKFKLEDILIGLNMQMLIYLLAIKQSNITNKNIIPTGFLYYPALVHYKKLSINTTYDEAINSIRDNLKMNGILNKDNLSLYNDDTIDNYIDIKSKGNIKEDKVLDTKDLNKVFDKVISILKEEGNSILNGNININPIIEGTNIDACEYCKFSSICKFNKDIDKPRRYKNLTKEEIFKKIEGDNNGMD